MPYLISKLGSLWDYYDTEQPVQQCSSDVYFVEAKIPAVRIAEEEINFILLLEKPNSSYAGHLLQLRLLEVTAKPACIQILPSGLKLDAPTFAEKNTSSAPLSA